MCIFVEAILFEYITDRPIWEDYVIQCDKTRAQRTRTSVSKLCRNSLQVHILHKKQHTPNQTQGMSYLKNKTW